MAKVIVAMSGGVDSAVTAALLIEQGFSVQGLTLQLWHASRTEQKGIERARQVAAQLGIPLHVQDVRESFQREVVQSFIKSHLSNETPNPCVLCNRALNGPVCLISRMNKTPPSSPRVITPAFCKAPMERLNSGAPATWRKTNLTC